MKIFKELKKLGYIHYSDTTIEALDDLPLNSAERISEQALVLRFFREKYNYWCKENQYPEDNSSDKKFSRKLTKKGIKNSSSHGIRIYTNIIFKN